MPNLNKVMLMGNLTRDPELRYTPNNLAVANLGLAVNRVWYNKQTNEKQEETTFVDCEAWGRTAEVLCQYLQKGRPVYLEGRLKLDQWEDKDGQKRSKLKVVVDQFQFIDSKQGQGGPPGSSGGPDGGSAGYNNNRGNAPRRSAPAAGGGGEPIHEPIEEGDIPF
ncbi:MAG: single-stranded DNA-binding protein [Phycisphaeraceae bacterium]|nr:single-stranded DNA-binding protein [Phycisphaeraceae bacterium]